MHGCAELGMMCWKNMGVAPQMLKSAPRTVKIAPQSTKVATQIMKVAHHRHDNRAPIHRKSYMLFTHARGDIFFAL